MTKEAGAYACTIEGFALAREIRARRVDADRTPKELAGVLDVVRAKIDALELGYYDSGDPRKRPGRLGRDEIIAMLTSGVLAIPAGDVGGLLYLAHACGAVADGEPFRPRRGHSEAEARASATAIKARHVAAFRARPLASSQAPDPEWAPPSQRCAAFVGRESEVASLVDALLDSNGPSLVLVSGFPGSGKSELLQVALRQSRLRAGFHGLRWLSARQREFLAGGSGASGTTSADDLLRELAASLRSTVDALPATLQATRWLIAVDNCEAVADEDALIGRLARIAGASRVVLTSRNTYEAPFIRNVPDHRGLGGLGATEARQVLTGGTPDAVSDTDASRIYTITRGAPLALQWFAGRLARDGIAGITDTHVGGSLYSFMFGEIWDRLSARSRDALDYLAHQTVDPVPSAVLDRSEVVTRSRDGGISELGERNLVESTRDGDELLLGLHPLAAAFARERLDGASRWAGRSETAWRTGLGYLRDALIHDARGSRAELPLGGIRNYLAWMRDALDAEAVDVVFVAWLKLSRYLWEHFHWSEFERCEEIAGLASERLGSSHYFAAMMVGGLSQTDRAYQCVERARYDDGLALLSHAKERFEALDDDAGRSLVHRYGALLYLRRGRPGDLVRSRQEFEATLAAIDSGRSRGFPAPGSGAATAAAELAQLGVWDTLVAGYAAYREAWAAGEAEVMNLMSGLLLKEGRAQDAIEMARRAIRVALDYDERWPGSEAAPMLNLARSLTALGDLDEARKALGHALQVARRAERRDLEGGALLQLAELESGAGHDDDARTHATAALAIARALGQPAEIDAAEALLHPEP